MKLRRFPHTADRLRESPRAYPDEICIRAYRTNWGTPRYLVEARLHGRPLGDQDFTTLEDARAFAGLEAKWHGARIVDECRTAGSA